MPSGQGEDAGDGRAAAGGSERGAHRGAPPDGGRAQRGTAVDGVRVRIAVPATAKRGEVLELKTLITHPMDNGFMFSRDGERIPRHIIHRFEALYNGALVFRADWHEAISTNPFISFHTVADESGRIEFRWYDDDGAVYTESADIEVG